MNWQTGLLVLLLLIVLLFLIYRLNLHWLWDLGFFLFFIILIGVILMNQNGVGGIQPYHWNAIAIIVLGYVALVMFAGSVCAIRTYTESIPELMKRTDTIIGAMIVGGALPRPTAAGGTASPSPVPATVVSGGAASAPTSTPAASAAASS